MAGSAAQWLPHWPWNNRRSGSTWGISSIGLWCREVLTLSAPQARKMNGQGPQQAKSSQNNWIKTRGLSRKGTLGSEIGVHHSPRSRHLKNLSPFAPAPVSPFGFQAAKPAFLFTICTRNCAMRVEYKLKQKNPLPLQIFLLSTDVKFLGCADLFCAVSHIHWAHLWFQQSSSGKSTYILIGFSWVCSISALWLSSNALESPCSRNSGEWNPTRTGIGKTTPLPLSLLLGKPKRRHSANQ